MNKLLTARSAKRLLVAGVVLLALSYAISLVSLWNIYGAVGNLDNEQKTSGHSLWQPLSRANLGLSVLGYTVTGLGLAGLIVVHARKKRP